MSLYGVEGPAGQVLMICTVVFGCLLGLAVLVSCKRLVGMMCDAKSPRVGPSSAGNKYAQLMANESLFRDEHPMKLPDLHTDLHRPVQWASLFYEDTPSTSQFNFAGDRIIFADKSSNIDDPTAISQLRSTHVDWRHTGADRGAARPDTNPETYTMCGQASRVLAPNMPDEIMKQVYYEMEVEFVHKGVVLEGKVQDAQVCIGWANDPYPPFGMLGDHPYSLGFHSNGYVKSSHGKDLLLLPGGYGVGDVIGCGYEYDVDQEVLNFFFTINGSRLAELPDRIGKISANEVRSFISAMSRPGKARRMLNEGGLFVLGAAPIPSVSALGSAVLQPRMKAPFVYDPKAPVKEAKSKTKRGRRHSTAGIATSGAPKARARRGSAVEDESSEREAMAEPKPSPKKRTRGRRMSAPALVGHAIKGWADRQTAVRANRRAPLPQRLARMVASGVGTALADAGFGEKVEPVNAPGSAAAARHRRASMQGGGRRGSVQGGGRRGSAMGGLASPARDLEAGRPRRSSVAGGGRRGSVTGGGRRGSVSSAAKATAAFKKHRRRSTTDTPAGGKGRRSSVAGGGRRSSVAGGRRASTQGRRSSTKGRRRSIA